MAARVRTRCVLAAITLCLGLFGLVSCGGSDPVPTVSGDPDPTTTTASSVDSVSEEATGETNESGEIMFPEVVAAEASSESGDSWRFDVTISSPYDSPERYADAWRVLGPDGKEYGIRVLTHDHAGEQPFTRSQSGIEIPPDVDVVTIEGRDLVNGWGGETLELTLER